MSVFLTLPLHADHWPTYRGPTYQGISTAKNLPLTFSETSNVKWKTEIPGKAWSSPVVWGNQIWVSGATEEGSALFAYCVDKNSGKMLHRVRLFVVPLPQYCHPFNSYASPSPVIEEGRVYITFGSEGTVCIDTASGKVVWSRSDININHFRGPGSSPTLWEDLLIMNFDGSDKQFVIALDKRTGETVWKTDRTVDYDDIDPSTGLPERLGDWRKAYSSPRVVEFDAKPLLISVGSKATYGYDPRTGAELWRAEHQQHHSVGVTPLVGHGLIYVCTGSRGELWAIKPGGSGVLSDDYIAWRYSRNVPGRGSPILVDDLIYMVDSQGDVATCLDAKTGEEIWKERLGGRGYSASPVYADGRIYFFEEYGQVTVIKPGRSFEIIARSELDEGFMASPAPIDGALIVRSRTHLYRLQETNRPSSE